MNGYGRIVELRSGPAGAPAHLPPAWASGARPAGATTGPAALRRWLKDPTFRAAVTAARAEIGRQLAVTVSYCRPLGGALPGGIGCSPEFACADCCRSVA